ncbi:MAG TPA: cytochrome c [Ignavibacteriaceae bacterium]|nr:cytochrome c [Ignavibacteriaceae bacterium]
MKINSIIMLVLFLSIVIFFGFHSNSITVFQQKPNLKDKGIGPIKEVKLGPIDQKLAEKGSNLFDSKCSPCHNLDDVNLAPPLRGITKVLSPEFIMNYLMNTTEMQKKDPYVQKLIQDWKTVPIMKDQQLKEKDARAVLEYLRTVENPE